MTVRIVTDSTCDLPREVVAEMGIAVVPLHVYFGREEFEDGVTISNDEFYRRLTAPGAPRPRTSAPPAGAFAAAYERIAQETDEIVSIHISSKLSATYGSALAGKAEVRTSCRIEILDSSTASLALGLLVLQAAKMAQGGASLEQIVHSIQSLAPRTRLFGALDTLEYLHRGGRIGRASAFLGSMLQVKPIVGLRDGVAYPIERVRGRARAVQRMCELIASHGAISHVVVGHTTDEAGMESLAEYLSLHFPGLAILRSRCGATLGTYFGPGAFGLALVEDRT
jgi:DegV family protein with EDD domain